MRVQTLEYHVEIHTKTGVRGINIPCWASETGGMWKAGYSGGEVEILEVREYLRLSVP